jgi:hypothetical protein
MRSLDAQLQPATRLATALGALCDFLCEPSCRQCEVLQVCLRHLQEDVAEHPSLFPRSLLRCLRRVTPFAYVRRHSPCPRCISAEILAAYLTPGEEVLPYGGGSVSPLSWLNGDEDMHW